MLTGLCFLPMRYIKKWSFENTWFAWCLLSLVILPPLIAWAFIPQLMTIYDRVGQHLVLLVLGSGLLAGMSGFLYGLGIARIGLAAANALSNGISLVLGSFIPLVSQRPEVLRTTMGAALLGGILLALVGVVISAIASHFKGAVSVREPARASGEATHASGSSQSAFWGIVVSVSAGLLFPVQNLGIAFADDFMKVARSLGSTEVLMTHAFYVPYFSTSFISNGIYSVIMWRRRGSLGEWRIAETYTYLWLILIMAVAWTLASLTYGWAMPFMGGYGPIISWPVSLAVCNIAAALAEYLYGDWQGRALRVLLWGLLFLTLSISIFGVCNAYFQENTHEGRLSMEPGQIDKHNSSPSYRL